MTAARRVERLRMPSSALSLVHLQLRVFMQASAVLRYLALPLRGAAAVLIAVFALLLLVAIKARWLGIPLALLLLSWFFKYAFVLLDHVTDGAIEPPVLSI